jgi:hypothetical protein
MGRLYEGFRWEKEAEGFRGLAFGGSNAEAHGTKKDLAPSRSRIHPDVIVSTSFQGHILNAIRQEIHQFFNVSCKIPVCWKGLKITNTNFLTAQTQKD